MTISPASLSVRTRRQVVTFTVIGASLLIATAVTLVLVLRSKDTKVPAPSDRPEVAVEQGVLRGEWASVDVPGLEHQRYAAFIGVPYALPPVGELRFKESSQQPGNVTGSEDCLYLNVYTPRTAPKKLLPVYFFVHGGTFVFGSGSKQVYGPDFLVLQDIVVVTINYRLGVFGYLNLDNEVVPGNAGLKDQVAALRWVHRNVARFGGDPNLITVGGQSAGAVSAHWLSVLPASRGFIKRVILESGSAAHSWGYNEDNLDVAVDLGRRLANGPVRPQEDVSRHVLELPAESIFKAGLAVFNERTTAHSTQLPFAVTPERRNASTALGDDDQPLVTKNPEMYLLSDDKPMLMGMNTREALTAYYTHGFNSSDKVQHRVNDLINAMPKNVLPYLDSASYWNVTHSESAWDDIVREVRHHYFERNNTGCDQNCIFKKYMDDILIGVDINRLAELRARSKRSQTFVYRFGARSNYSLSPLVEPDVQLKGGAVHSDELGYIWRIKMFRQKVEGDGLASTTLRRMTAIWGSYIKAGNPTPPQDIFNGTTWMSTENREKTVIFMDVAEELSVKEEHIAGVKTPFWLSLYQKYRNSQST